MLQSMGSQRVRHDWVTEQQQKLDKLILKYIQEVKGPKFMGKKKKKQLKNNKVKEFSRLIVNSSYLRKCSINTEIDKLTSATKSRGQEQAYMYVDHRCWTKVESVRKEWSLQWKKKIG